MPLTIRKALLADLPIIVEYNRLLALETENKHLDLKLLAPGVTAVLADPQRGTYWMALNEGRIVGQLMITLEWSDWRNGWFWWIQSVYVHADARRQGVFRSLFAHVEAEAQRAGDVVGIRLYVEQHNTAAQKTYADLLMHETGYSILEKNCDPRG
jgi:GNAT superfamily N-acetyltransferase